MLNSLTVKNFALIEDLELAIGEDFTIITGETGAGKSILLGALSLLLGKRADLKSLKNPDEKCIVEGVFSIKDYRLDTLFDTQDLDYDPQTIIRREILPSGRSRAFINDTPVKLRQLSALGGQLVDIHSQHESLFVGNTNYQYHVIDTLADNTDLLSRFTRAHAKYENLRDELEVLKEQQREAQKTYDYHLFLLNELKESNLEPGMQEELEERYDQLSHGEDLKENLSAALQQLQQEDFGILGGLQDLKNRLSALEDFGQSYKELSERMQSALLEIEDMTQEIENLYDSAEIDPQALEETNNQLQNLYSLQNKHNVSSVEELLALQTEFEEKVATSENADEEKAQLETKVKKARQKTDEIAGDLQNNREKATPKFIKSAESILHQLGMPNARLKIDIKPDEDFNTWGQDKMEWQFSANKGGRFQPLKKSASGGELSRITLAIKSILAQYSNLPTIVFDEIDTGVSGEIARKMGNIMNEMGERMQVISITHLPQIAAKGDQHFKIFKESRKDSTQTVIQELHAEDRIEELAEMLGGKAKTESAVAHAKSLLNWLQTEVLLLVFIGIQQNPMAEQIKKSDREIPCINLK